MKLKILGTATEPQTVEVSPGLRTKRVLNADELNLTPPQLGIFRWTPAGDGTWRAVVLVQERMVRVNVLAKLLGIDRMALYRLANAGFLRSDRPTPSVLRINIDSWVEHCERVADDPWFWEKPENAKKYRESI